MEPKRNIMKSEPRRVVSAVKIYYPNVVGAISFPTRFIRP